MKIHFSKRPSLFIIFLVFCFIVLPFFANSAEVEAAASTRVYGMVVDGTSRPIPNVYVIFWDPKGGIITETKTNASGGYDVEVVGLGSYEVYAFCNNEFTPGFDFVPAFRKVSLNGTTLNISFELLPGASINVTGDLQDLRTIEFARPPMAVDFTVVDQFGLLNEIDSVTQYGRSFRINRILNLNSRTVVVPSDMPVKIKVKLYYYLFDSVRQLTIEDKGEYLNLTQGSQITVDLRSFISRANIDYVQARLQSVQDIINEAVEVGLYASYESIRLSRAEDLVKSAYSALTQGDHDYVYANLHEALLIIEDVEEGLPSAYVNVSRSVLFITPFLGFTAVALASVLFDSMHRRLITSLALYGVLLGLLYFLYPGYIILQKTAYNPWVATIFEDILVPLLIGTSFLVAFFVIQVLPRAFREKTSMEGLKFMSAIAAAFSVAARNLRRKRLRAFLTSSFMLTSVFAFVILTSVSFEQGFFIQSHRGRAPTEGFLIRKRARFSFAPIGETTLFMPIEPTVLQWLENRPESALVVPKIENTPQVGTNAPPPPLAALYAPNSSSSFFISGALGVYPSLEVKVTKMDDIVAQGKFLGDGDLNGILISEEAAETLQAEVNTTLKFYGRSFIVTGIFNSKKLGELKDLDGAPLVPQQVILKPTQMGFVPMIEYVPSETVAILHGETVKNLGWDVQISHFTDLSSQRADQPSPHHERLENLPGLPETYDTDNGHHAVDVTAYGANIPYCTWVEIKITFWLTHWNTLRLEASWANETDVKKAVPKHGWCFDWPFEDPLNPGQYLHTFNISNDDDTHSLTVSGLSFNATMDYYGNLTEIIFPAPYPDFTLAPRESWSTNITALGTLNGGHIYFKYYITEKEGAKGEVVSQHWIDHPVTTALPLPLGLPVRVRETWKIRQKKYADFATELHFKLWEKEDNIYVNGMVISRVNVQTQEFEDTMNLARLAVLVWPDVQTFVSLAGKLQYLFIGSAYVVKGFAEGMVPLVLVVLNVGVMMLSAVYERKREAFIMSTVGLNPFHIGAVFVAEALTLSVVAGSLGYFLGIAGYRFLAVFAVSVGVKQKVEAFWGILALSFSIVAAVLGSVLPATKTSLIATPSLLRKWKIRVGEKPQNAMEPWVLKMPLRIRSEDLGKFFSFMERRLEGYTSYYVVEGVENLRISRNGKAEPRLSFTYIYTEEGVVTDNELIPVKSDISNLYTLKLTVQTRIYKMGFSGKIDDEAHIRRTATFVRRLILEYSLTQGLVNHKSQP